MEEEKEREYKLYIRVTPEFYAKFKGWAERLGLNMNQFGNMCIQAGIGSIIRAVSPEDAFTPEQIVAIMKAADRKGIDLTFTDFISRDDKSDG
jgi:hypothetical protein